MKYKIKKGGMSETSLEIFGFSTMSILFFAIIAVIVVAIMFPGVPHGPFYI